MAPAARSSSFPSTPVLYPYVTVPDILVVMSQEAYVKFGSELKDGGIMIVEQDLVRVADLKKNIQVYQHPCDSHRRRTGQAHGAEFRDGRVLYRGYAVA